MLFEPGSPRFYTIPAAVSFVDALADGLLSDCADDPIALSRVQILVLTRRSVGALRTAFLRRSLGRALLLPQIQPVGDPEEEDLPLVHGSRAFGPATSHWRHYNDPQARSGGGQATLPGEAVRLAKPGRFIDSLAEQEIDPTALKTLVPDIYASIGKRPLSS